MSDLVKRLRDHYDSYLPCGVTSPALELIREAADELERLTAHQHEWIRTGAMPEGQARCIQCGEWLISTSDFSANPVELWKQALNACGELKKFAISLERAGFVGPQNLK